MLVVVFLVSKAPDNTATQGTLPPNGNVPPLGTTGVPSPATTGGSPFGSATGQTILNSTSQLAGTGGMTPAPPMPSSRVINTAATNVPEVTKSLVTQIGNKQVATLGDRVVSGTFRKL
jgi:hypothetical protein